jgi:hypothetical protein
MLEAAQFAKAIGKVWMVNEFIISKKRWLVDCMMTTKFYYDYYYKYDGQKIR